jgi:hypothetical protein
LTSKSVEAFVAEPPQLDFRMWIAVQFAPPLAIEGSLWRRRILYVTCGQFEGPELRGDVLAGGGDWILIRGDGSAELDIRFTLQTSANELLYLRSTGVFVATDGVLARIRSGEAVPRDDYYFRTTILFETASPRLSRFNRALHVGVGQRTPDGMITNVFAIS